MAVKTNFEVNGKNYFRTSVSVGKDSDGKLIRKTFYGKSQKEAESKKKEYLDGLSSGLSIDYKNAFLGSTMKVWLFEVVNISNNVKPTTFERYEGIYRNYISNSDIARLNISNIKSLQIQRYYNKLKGADKTTSQIFNLNKLLKHFFMYAINEGLIVKNPCMGLVIPGKKEESKEEVEIFSDTELNAIISLSKPCLVKDLAIVCLSTGMRRGEALGLNWSDIDYVNNEIHIKRSVKTVTFIDKEGNRELRTITQTTKTRGSVRDIPLPLSLVSTLTHIKSKQAENKLKAAQSYLKENEGYVFLSENGQLIDSSNISRAWGRLLKRCKVPHKKFHALRHTYATKQFEADIPMLTVSKLLGHSSIDITSNTYTHVQKKEKEKAFDILSVIKMC